MQIPDLSIDQYNYPLVESLSHIEPVLRSVEHPLKCSALGGQPINAPLDRVARCFRNNCAKILLEEAPGSGSEFGKVLRELLHIVDGVEQRRKIRVRNVEQELG